MGFGTTELELPVEIEVQGEEFLQLIVAEFFIALHAVIIAPVQEELDGEILVNRIVEGILKVGFNIGITGKELGLAGPSEVLEQIPRQVDLNPGTD